MFWTTLLSAEDTQFVLHSLDPNIKVDGVDKKFHPRPYNEEDFKIKTSLPPRHYREKMFEQAELNLETKRLDELDRDLIYLKASRGDLAALRKKHPQLPLAKLEKLRQLIKGGQ